jgi:hypothetical protein
MRAARLITLVLMLALTLGWEGALGDRDAPSPEPRRAAALAGSNTDASFGDLRTSSFWQEVRRSSDRGRTRPLLLGLLAAGHLVIGLRFLWTHFVCPSVHSAHTEGSLASNRSPPRLATI